MSRKDGFGGIARANCERRQRLALHWFGDRGSFGSLRDIWVSRLSDFRAVEEVRFAGKENEEFGSLLALKHALHVRPPGDTSGVLLVDSAAWHPLQYVISRLSPPLAGKVL